MMRLLTGAALLSLADAAAKCVTYDGADYADTTLSVTADTLDDQTLCALTGSADLGVTPGTCADAGTTATCALVAGEWDANGVVTAETCTSSLTAAEILAQQKAACATQADGSVQWIGEYAQESAIGPSPSRKTWWTKRLNAGTGSSAGGDANPVAWDRIYTGGQPSERDLKMMYEQGFDGVYSLWPFPTPGDGKEIDSGTDMPTGTEARAAAAEAGLLYGMIPLKSVAGETAEACLATDGTDDDEGCADALVPGCATSCTGTEGCSYTAPVAAVAANTPIDWTSTESIDAVEKFMDFALANTDGPIYLHCYIGRTSTVALQAYRARKAAAAAAGFPAIVPQAGKSITQTAIIEASYHGFDLSRPAWEAVFAREAGETLSVALADATPAVPAATEGCDVVLGDGETAGDTTCDLVAASGSEETCDFVAADCTRTAGTGTCTYRAAVCGAPEVPAVTTATTGTAGATPTVGPTVGLPQYHWLKPLGTLANGVHMYDAGQIHAEHLDAIRAAGIVSVVNMRKQGPIDGDAVSYVEETNLLNVKKSAKTQQWTTDPVEESCEPTEDCTGDGCPACSGYTPGTESTCDPDIVGCSYTSPVTGVRGYRNDPAYYAGDGSQHILAASRADGWTALAGENFEVLNEHEFGDDATKGYDQTAEAAAFAATDKCTVVPGTCSQEAVAETTCGAPVDGACGAPTAGDGSCAYVPAIRYVNLPVGGSINPGYDAAGLVEYSDELIDAINYATAQGGDILFHCRTGYRAGAFASALLAALGIQAGEEVAERMVNMGYDVATIEGKAMAALLAGVADTTWTPADPPAGSPVGHIAGSLTLMGREARRP
jgi:protein tyrosine phosphatase (PTP) superfamily phosphohydrolase (DUF442 family)